MCNKNELRRGRRFRQRREKLGIRGRVRKADYFLIGSWGLPETM